MSRIITVAGNEFGMTIKNPVVLIAISILAVIAVVSSYGFTLNAFNDQGQEVSQLSVFIGSLGGDIYDISCILSILAVCLGVFSIAEERHGGTLNVLLCKPVYRRDILMGKFAGLGGFMLIVTSLVFILRVSSALVIHPMPAGSLIEIAARTMSLIVSLFLFCMVMLGLSMMISSLFKNIALITTITATIVYLQWYTPIFILLGPLNVLDPKLLAIYYSWGMSDNTFIFRMSLPYLTWLSIVYPYFILLTIEAALVVLADCIIFNREGN